VVNGVNGYKVNSYKRMAKAAVKLISSKSTRTNLSNNAIRLSKKYSWEIIAFTWYNYLRKLNN